MRLTHNTTIMIRGKEHASVTWEYTDNAQLNERIDIEYKQLLEKYGYADIIKAEIAKSEVDPKYGLELVYEIEDSLYHAVKTQFMYKYGGLKKPEPTQMDRLLEQVRNKSAEVEHGELYDARVELYTKIVCLFQEFGGIPKVSTN